MDEAFAPSRCSVTVSTIGRDPVSGGSNPPFLTRNYLLQSGNITRTHSSAVERPSHKRMVASSNLAESTKPSTSRRKWHQPVKLEP